MRYRNSKPALILRWVTVALIICAVALSYGDCLVRYSGDFWDDPGVTVTRLPMPLAEMRYLMLAAALLLVLRHYGGDIVAGLFMVLPTLACVTVTEIMGLIYGGLYPGPSYDYTNLGIVVAVLACVSFASVWFMALVLRQPPKQTMDGADPAEEAQEKARKKEKDIKAAIVTGIIMLLIIIFRDAIINVLNNLLRGIF